jgi:glycosyltransferase involved in cell wall biosynthesis
MKSKKAIILTLVGNYLPGYKSGGPLRSINNIVDYLSDEFEFWIITSDRDVGDSVPYPNIVKNQWQEVGKAKVYYLSKHNSGLRDLANLIANTPHDILYLNSFFNPVFTFKTLLARRLGWLPLRPTILSPLGEFSIGALKIKHLKKLIYIHITKFFRFYHAITWRASSSYEKLDIIRVLGTLPKDIQIALDLPSKSIKSDNTYFSNIDSNINPSVLRIIFLSRITLKKNLDYALRVLSQVKAEIIFDIYGPLEDLEYWKTCQNLIQSMPSNITVAYNGSVLPDEIAATFSQYDLFLFPTYGENYGHVIAESLSVGVPVLLSDQTPWRNLETEGLGWDFSLQDMSAFVNTIESLALTSPVERRASRSRIVAKTRQRLLESGTLEANQKLFRSCLTASKEMSCSISRNGLSSHD